MRSERRENRSREILPATLRCGPMSSIISDRSSPPGPAAPSGSNPEETVPQADIGLLLAILSRICSDCTAGRSPVRNRGGPRSIRGAPSSPDLSGRQLEPEPCAALWTVFRPDAAAVGLGEGPHDRQSEAARPRMAASRGTGLEVALEDMRQSFGRDSCAGVLHRDANDFGPAGSTRQTGGAQRHGAALGSVSQGVVDQGADYLAQPDRVGGHRQARRADHRNSNTAGGCARLEAGDHRRENLANVELLDRESTRLNSSPA